MRPNAGLGHRAPKVPTHTVPILPALILPMGAVTAPTRTLLPTLPALIPPIPTVHILPAPIPPIPTALPAIPVLVQTIWRTCSAPAATICTMTPRAETFTATAK